LYSIYLMYTIYCIVLTVDRNVMRTDFWVFCALTCSMLDGLQFRGEYYLRLQGSGKSLFFEALVAQYKPLLCQMPKDNLCT